MVSFNFKPNDKKKLLINIINIQIVIEETLSRSKTKLYKRLFKITKKCFLANVFVPSLIVITQSHSQSRGDVGSFSLQDHGKTHVTHSSRTCILIEVRLHKHQVGLNYKDR